MHQPGPGLPRVDQRVVIAGRVHHPGQHGRLHQRQPVRRPAEVTAAGGVQAVVAVTVVGHLGVHAQDLRPAVGLVELDRHGQLLQVLGEAAVAARVQVLRQLLVDGAAALVLVSGDPGDHHPAHGQRVYPGIGVEPVVFGRDQGLREVRRDRRARVGDVAVPSLRLDQRGGLARRRGQQEQQADGDGEHQDDGEEHLREPEGDPGPPPGPHRPGRALARRAGVEGG